MKRLCMLLLLLPFTAAHCALAAVPALQSVGLSIGWNNHNNHWDNDWRYNQHNRHSPYYGFRRPWFEPHDYWRNDTYRSRYDNRFNNRYSTRYRRPTQQVKVVPSVAATTVRSEQVRRDSVASLPANARLEKTASGIIYRWQQQCYQLDQISFRYQQLPCP